MAGVPAWKLALLERKKKQDENEKAKKVEEEVKKLASLPAWKRAILLREKQAMGRGVAPTIPTHGKPAAKNSSALLNSANASSVASHTNEQHSDKWQVAVERVKGADSPILRRSSWSRTTSPKEEVVSSSSPKQPAKTLNQSFSGVSSTRSKSVLDRWKSAVAATLTESPPPWSTKSTAPKLNTLTASTAVEKSNISSSRIAINSVAPMPTASVAPMPTASVADSAAPGVNRKPANGDEEDPSLVGLPAWKKAIVLKKRKAQQQKSIADAEPKREEVVGEDETDSVSVVFSDKPTSPAGQPKPDLPPSLPNSTAQQRQPEVVNRLSESKSSDQRLVEQEGKTLHPPIYKEVNQWANVREEDEKFKNLPLWKQALIKRRRVDIALRSGQPMPHSPTPEPAGDVPMRDKATKSPNKTTSTVNSTKTPRKQPVMKSGTSHTRKSKTVTEKASKNQTQPDVGKRNTNKHVRNEAAVKPVRKAPAVPVRKAPAVPVVKNTPALPNSMFTYNFSKSSRHSLDTGDSSDSTDSDLEEAIVTNLDDESDASDSGIVLQSYKPSGQKETLLILSPQNSSILALPGKKKKNLRRVSWSDSNLVMQHTYPKYDYSDYDDLEQKEPSSMDNSIFSHRLHPSLRQVNDSSSADPYISSFSPSGYMQGGSLGNFVPSSLAPGLLGSDGYAELSPSQEDEEDMADVSLHSDDLTNEYYTDQTSNAAALLW